VAFEELCPVKTHFTDTHYPDLLKSHVHLLVSPSPFVSYLMRNRLNLQGVFDCNKFLLPGAGLEPARTLPGPRDFKSRVSTNSTIRARMTSTAIDRCSVPVERTPFVDLSF
jgi:hypothetical protein